MDQGKNKFNYKLSNILTLVEKNKQEFKSVTDSIQDESMKKDTIELVEKSVEYAKQLNTTLKKLRNKNTSLF
jgi:N-acetylglucosamine-6-phosphate deacetylase